VTNTVITKQNARHLPELARMLIGLGVVQYQLAFPHPTGHAATYFRGVVPRMSEIAGFVHEALALGRAAGVSCMAEAMPFCMMAGYEREVSELHIPPTEIVYDGYVVPDYGADRMARGKTRFAPCASCRFEPICEGPWREYPAGMGEAEFVPVAGAKVIDPQVVLDDRFVLLGSIAPALPQAGAGWRAVCFVPQAGSPGCTAQLCSLAQARSELERRGIAEVVISPDSAEAQARWGALHGSTTQLVADPEREHARHWMALDSRGAVRRSSYLVDPSGRIAHIVVAVDTAAHGRQLADAFDRLHAPARPLERGPELVMLRRRAAEHGAA
jgi:thioredoxin-dependent peroxiredoxin